MWYLEWQEAKLWLRKPFWELYFCDLLLVTFFKLLQTFLWLAGYCWPKKKKKSMGCCCSSQVSSSKTSASLIFGLFTGLPNFTRPTQQLSGAAAQAGASSGSRLGNLVKSWMFQTVDRVCLDRAFVCSESILFSSSVKHFSPSCHSAMLQPMIKMRCSSRVAAMEQVHIFLPWWVLSCVNGSPD